jgi:hypothetical protein
MTLARLLLITTLGAASTTLGAVSGAAFAQAAKAPQTGAAVSRPAAGEPRTLGWKDLVPADFRMDELLARFQQESATMTDGDPRAQQLLKELAEAYRSAPVVPALDGQLVRLPGFVVPLDGDLKNMKSFLLVPYFGACIHTPPPPSNQIVHVVSDKPLKGNDLLADAVWVTGVMSAKASRTDLADAGYVLRIRDVKPYRPDAK